MYSTDECINLIILIDFTFDILTFVHLPAMHMHIYVCMYVCACVRAYSMQASVCVCLYRCKVGFKAAAKLQALSPTHSIALSFSFSLSC